MVKTIAIQGFPHAYDLSAPTKSPVVLVFIHGWLLSRAYWHPIIEQLAPDYQCLSYDLRGFGASQWESEPSGLTTAATMSMESALIAGSPDSRSTDHRSADNRGADNRSADHRSADSRNTDSRSADSPAFSVSTQPSVATLKVEARQIAIHSPSQRYTPAAYADDLIQLLQQLNIDRAWVIGHSLGGSIALWAADLAPQTIAGVVCVNAGGGIYLKEEFERFRTIGKRLVQFRPRWLSYLPLLDSALARTTVARPLARHWGRQRLLDLLAAEPAAALGALLDSTTEDEVNRLPHVVSRLQQPVHFIAGQQDTVMEPGYVHHLASFHRLFECCSNNVIEIDNCGHMAMVEQPAIVTQEIRSVLDRYGL